MKKDDELKQFFANHKESLPDDGFAARLSNQLDLLPRPTPAPDRTNRIVGLFTLVGVVVFVLLGGYDILLKGMLSLGGLFDGTAAFNTETMASILIMLLAFGALIRISVRDVLS